MVMASCPLVRNTRSSGRPITRDFTGSAMWAAGIHCRAPIRECPVFSRTYDRCTGIDPVLHPAGAPHVLPLDPRSGLAFLLLPRLIPPPPPDTPPTARPAGPP